MRRIRRTAAAGVAIATAVLVPPAHAYARPGHYIRVDVAASGQPAADGEVRTAAISSSGRYVAFDSSSSTLVPGDTNQVPDVFLRDLQTGRTVLVSRGIDGLPGVGGTCLDVHCPTAFSTTLVGSFNPAVSATGRFVVFASGDLNLVAGDTNGMVDVFRYDRLTGNLRRVSLGAGGAQADGSSLLPSLSADGRYVAFTSYADNLVRGDTNGQADVFVYDVHRGTTVRADVSSAGAQAGDVCQSATSAVPGAGPAASTCPLTPFPRAWISADGTHVAFDSTADNLVAGDSNATPDVFERDLRSGKTVRVSVATGGAQALTTPNWQDGLDASEDGSFLSNGYCQSKTAPMVSADGRYTVFFSRAYNLVPRDGNESPGGAGIGVDVFVHDLRTDHTTRVSVTSAGEENGAGAGLGFGTVLCPASISPDGRFVTWIGGPPSWGGPFNVYDRHTGALDHVPASYVDGAGDRYEFGPSSDAAVSTDGRYVVTTMIRMTHCPGPGLCGPFVFRWDRGNPLGVGSLVGSGRMSVAGASAFRTTGVVFGRDSAIGSVVPADADILSASLTYRPRTSDLLLRENIAALPTGIVPSEVARVYGFDLTASGRRFEVRVSDSPGPWFDAAGGGSFGLFEQRADGTWSQLTALRGGFGRTGPEIVAAVPLRTLGVQDGGRLSGVRAFTAIGTHLTGPTRILDTVALGD